MKSLPLTFVFAALAMQPTLGAESQPLPEKMRAVAIDQPGGVEELKVRTLPVPEVGADEILVAVNTAGVAVWDTFIRSKLAYINKPAFPYVLGSDGSGTVVGVGESVMRFKVGDEVYGYCWDNPKGGFYAEYVAASADCFSKLPKGVSLEAAGVLGASGLTALSGIDRALAIKPDDTLIIHGASGAVGTLALQLAKVRGARVLATASGDEGVELVRRLGADAAIDGRKGDILAAARAFAPKGVDAVLALAGGPAMEKALEALREGGRVAYPNGVDPAPRGRPGITVIPYDALFGDQKDQFAQLNQAIEVRPFDVPIAATFDLGDAAQAHQRVEAGRVAGKVALKIR